ncbi:MAG TPA: (deoxy)nucleoside triphosphate pyrophosphohydrolase [Atopostipes sp.]|nr:(deoxy)nucleoside triphosphate pyrophosphohydrolase [Atopostipes sp.]
MTNKLIEVVGAAIIKDNKVLAMQRSEQMTLSGMWEFPGGKIEKNETEEEALIREIKEELKIDIKVNEYVNEASYTYEFGTVSLKVYTAEIISGQISLLEHSDGKWLTSEELDEVNWAPVDIPAAKTLKNILNKNNAYSPQ